MTGPKVYLVKLASKSAWYLEWVDPISGARKRQSTRVPKSRRGSRSEAEAIRAAKEAELAAGAPSRKSRATWGELRERFLAEHVGPQSEKYAASAQTAFNSIESLLDVREATALDRIDNQAIAKYLAELRKQEVSEATVDTYSRTLRVAFSWAVTHGLVGKAPVIPTAKKKACRPRARAVTAEEFDRMLAAVPKVVGEALAAEWQFYLRGLWESGLRLEESVELYWDRLDRHRVNLDGRRSTFLMLADFEKSGRGDVLPMTPECVELLECIPRADRRGRVFRMRGKRGGLASFEVAKHYIADFGREAGILVDVHPQTGKKKYASAHDLRRGFLTRWAPKVSPTTLRALARHRSIQTTLAYYITSDAISVNGQLWASRDATPSEPLSDSERSANRAEFSDLFSDPEADLGE